MRTILIDTHILLWTLYDSNRIIKDHQLLLINPENQILVSTASLFELGIKKSIGKLQTPHNVSELLDLTSFEELTISSIHIDVLSEIEWFHKDPFDKMIIAQALSENLEIISYDSQFKKYSLMLI